MRRLIGRWKARHLFLAWLAYWTALAASFLAPAVPALWRMSRDGWRGDAGAAITDGVLKLSLNPAGSTHWTASVSFMALALAVVGPPIVVWLYWLSAASAARAASESERRAELQSGEELPLRAKERESDSIRR